MAYFPHGIIPKNLMQETAREVDNSPTIYNAKDYNDHLRELIAIEKFLVGDGDTSENRGLSDLVKSLTSAFSELINGGGITQISGVVSVGNTIPFPSGTANTRTVNNLGIEDQIIYVNSVDGFPTSGYITKFNSIKASITQGGTFNEFGFISICNQELISYTGVQSSPAAFTGCTRGLDGTKQSVSSDSPAAVVAGRASLFLAPKAWTALTDVPAQFYVDHDALLLVGGGVFAGGLGAKTAGTAIHQHVDALYTLTVCGAFNLNVSEP
jgi:hypothetical protein